MYFEEAVAQAVRKALQKLGIKTMPSNVAIIPEETYEFDGGGFVAPVTNALNIGDEVTTVIDGVEYKDKAKAVETGAEHLVCVGNAALLGQDDNPEAPYLMYVSDIGNGPELVFSILAELDSTETTTHTVHAYKQTITTTPISDKYLPGVCLPVVELSTPLRDEYPEGVLDLLTESDGVALEAAIATKMPFAIRCVVTTEEMQLTMAGCCTGVVVGDIPFSASLCTGGVSYLFMRADNGWVVGMA